MLGAAATCWPGVLAQGASGHDGLTCTEPCRAPGFPVTLDMHAMPRCPVSQHSAHSRDWPRNRWPQSGLRTLPSCLVLLRPTWGATTLEDTRQDTLLHERGADMPGGWPLGTQLPACVASSRPSRHSPDTGHQAESQQVGVGGNNTIQPLCQLMAHKTPINKSSVSSQILIPKAGSAPPPVTDLSA